MYRDLPKEIKETAIEYKKVLEKTSGSESLTNDLLYGVVEWFNDKTILDGMPYFDDIEKAIQYAKVREDMGGMGMGKVKYTIIRLERAT